MNGSVPVVSYLLYLGADPNTADSSGNTLVHYATAYGWYFVLKLLVNEGGADPKTANEWKVWYLFHDYYVVWKVVHMYNLWTEMGNFLKDQ